MKTRPYLSSKRYGNLLNKGEKAVVTSNGGKYVHTYLQIVRTSPEYVLEGKYLTKKGIRLINQPNLTQEEKDLIYRKYCKNKYVLNPDSKPLRQVKKIGLYPNGMEYIITVNKAILHN